MEFLIMDNSHVIRLDNNINYAACKMSITKLKLLFLGVTMYGFITVIIHQTPSAISSNRYVKIKRNVLHGVDLNVSGSVNHSSSFTKENKTDVRIHRRKCDSCFHHNFNYVIQNKQICNIEAGEYIDLLILILTTHKNKEARSALRSTWLSHSKNNSASVRYAFLLGETSDGKLKKALLQENMIFHDIIKEDFVDTYMNLTYKTIMGLKWAATQCAHARYVMKTDDDMFVNIPNLLKVMKGKNSTELGSSIFGSCYKQEKPNRNKKSKWFASAQSYPEKLYPRFCSGTGYVASMKIVTAIYNISPSVSFFHLEDVYIALCVRNLGFKTTNIIGFHNGQQKLDPCIYHGKELITSHRLSPAMLLSIWKRSCSKSQSS